MGKRRNVSTILVVKPEETDWKPSSMWEDNVKIDVKYTTWWESVCTRYTCLSIGSSGTVVNKIMTLGVL